jgi:cyclopropane fatty-acyl-phospholipid synthase-like methyltransferase
MDRKFVGVEHAFHDADYARDWAGRFTPTPDRLALFDTILETLRSRQPVHVLELGTGPGYFAERLLAALPGVTYEGLDFSLPMLHLAGQRLGPFAGRIRLLQADLVQGNWGASVRKPVGAIVSTWALHDLGGQEQTASVYRTCASLLDQGGVLLNGDFVKPDGTPHDYEAGRFTVARHLELLAAAGFGRGECLGRWEEELENPTTAQNYACLLAVK